ncbi:MAG: FAD-dependent urate hydroxylase [Nocardioidaceae bacterium]|jgi:cation diffusion facilitator CzcD-associated flavoprotein CzcO|nr:FAD-dependent urate hydroxylase [Nocardioidaceae bacterium]
MDEIEIAVIGAGPHGLAAAAHLRRAGAECQVFGDPMSFWRTMPAGMLLRSNWPATCIAEHEGPLSLDSYCAATGCPLRTPVPLERFIEYGTWVQQQVAPDVDPRHVERAEYDGDRFVLTMDDGVRLRAQRVVVAAGIDAFVHRPSVSAGLPAELVSHSADHRDLSRFRGQRVLVVGGGQSALESAALMHESGAEVEVLVRANHLNWLHGGKYHRKLGRLAPIVYAPTDVGPMGISRIVAVPDLFRRLPRTVQASMAARAIRPAGAAWLKPRLEEVPLHLGRTVRAAKPVSDKLHVEVDDGRTRIVDHLLFGTGYRVDITRYPFLDPGLASRVKSVDGYPVLRRGMESSIPGLHFLGAPAARSYGPIMRFVAGGWFGAATLTDVVTGNQAPKAQTTSAAPSGMGR